MNILVESIKRLYLQNSITLAKIDSLLKAKKITKEEYLYILGKEGNAE